MKFQALAPIVCRLQVVFDTWDGCHSHSLNRAPSRICPPKVYITMSVCVVMRKSLWQDFPVTLGRLFNERSHSSRLFDFAAVFRIDAVFVPSQHTPTHSDRRGSNRTGAVAGPGNLPLLLRPENQGMSFLAKNSREDGRPGILI